MPFRVRMLLVPALFIPIVTQIPAQPGDAPRIVASPSQAIVATESGKVQGFIHNGMYVYRGIPYAKAERFMPPAKPDSWKGVRPMLVYGYICPQLQNRPLSQLGDFIGERRFWPQSESCQNLNIWTPAINDGKKRPVMVWLHGGGYSEGSSIEQRMYDGENLSRKGDVVVVSINHRLNILGFLDLSAYGEKYKYSGNVGTMDMVAALAWVRQNIAGFGGDPGNVTIFGQSGGGGKVVTLLATPAAKGLFQKAVSESGTSIGTAQLDGKLTRRTAQLLLQQLGLDPTQVGKLQQMPYDQLCTAGDKALAAALEESGRKLSRPFGWWAPVVDGDYLPHMPFAGQAPEESADVPLLIGTTQNESLMNPTPRLKGRESWGIDEVTAYLKELYGDKTDAVIAAFRKTYPKMKPNEWPLVDNGFRPGTLNVARVKAARKAAPVYNYLFTWRSPVMDYAWASGHSMEIPFVFNNPVEGEQMTGAGKQVYALTEKVSQAWINFARTGNPNAKGLPAWPAFTPGNQATMILDSDSFVAVGHDSELMSLIGN